MSERLSRGIVDLLTPHVDRRSLIRMRVVTGRPGCWLPVLLRASAVTVGRRVFFRRGRYDPETARGLALIAHEAMHVEQYRHYGFFGFLARYLWGWVRVRGRHRLHPMEAPLIAAQRRIRVKLERELSRGTE
jgi:hypothetical protein